MKIVMHRQGFTELLKSSGVRSHLRDRGERVAQSARASAPVESGHYRGSIRTEVEDHRTRSVAHVHADAPYALVVEANTGNLARSLDAGGGR